MATKNFDKLRSDLDRRLDALPDGEGDAIRARVAAKFDAELADTAQSLGELRKARRLTQSQLSVSLGVTQAQVSRIENQTDVYLSTLSGYLHAVGGELEIVGVFPGKDGRDVRVPLAVNDLAPEPEPA
jgi:helix-turn-helix protein